MMCSKCGCTDDDACIDDEGQPCCWVAESLCSACAGQDAPPERDADGFVFDSRTGLWLP